MSHDRKCVALVKLARCLASSSEGMTLAEIQAECGIKRRAAEHYRDDLKYLFPQMEEILDGAVKRWRIPGAGIDSFFRAPTTEELLELKNVATELEQKGEASRAAHLHSLEQKIRSAMRNAALRKIDTDLEALTQSEFVALPAMPKRVVAPKTLQTVRGGLLAAKMLKFVYAKGKGQVEVREVHPLGIIFSRSSVLVALEKGEPAGSNPKHFRLDRMSKTAILDETAQRPAGFQIGDYARQSFGIFHGEQEDIVLHVLPGGLEDGVLTWQFHPNQTVEHLQEGGALVRFRASGINELVWHLFSWGNHIEILEPEHMRLTMLTQLIQARDQHDGVPRHLQKSRLAASNTSISDVPEGESGPKPL